MPIPALSIHAQSMLKEREILEEWVWRAIDLPDQTAKTADGNIHYLKKIAERDDRVLRVIVNETAVPSRVVTVFFDRRMREKV
jgi:hypothetical protein